MVYSERTIGSERAHLIHVEMNIRVASVADLDDILRIQALAYGEYFNEPAEALMAKLMLATESSFIAEVDEVVCAYGIAFPWECDTPVVLHSIDIVPPKIANVMYIHDVAVDPQHHKMGIAQSLVDAIIQRSNQLGIHSFELVAVQNSAEFWMRNGFTESGITGAAYGVGAIKIKR